MVPNVWIKSDSAGAIRGVMKSSATPQGLLLEKGSDVLTLPIGSPAQHAGRNIVSASVDGRNVTFAVKKFGTYQDRFARDVAAWLRGERPAPQDNDYKLEPYLLLLAFLPFGIMIVTRGGAIWGGIGGALAMLCFVVAQNEKLSLAVRVLVMLLISAAAYSAVIALVMSTAARH